MRLFRQIVSVGLLLLYSYNLAGYLAIFSAYRHVIRAGVETHMHSATSAHDLAVLSFDTQLLHRGSYPIQWKQADEIRYLGKLYDVVAVREKGEMTEFICINDQEEEKLYEELTVHVRNQCNDASQYSPGGGTNNPLKDSLPTMVSVPSPPPRIHRYGVDRAEQCESVALDTQVPPPRILQAI